MFESKSEIGPYLDESELFPLADEIAKLCAPAVAFERAGAGEAACGQLGGEPRLPASLPWPVRPAYRDGKAMSARLGGRSSGFPRAFEGATPLYFVGEIDLAVLKAAGALEARFPSEGRLLFFWDPLCGPWIDSNESCRVIFDRSPVSALERRAPPAELDFFKENDLMPTRFTETPLKPVAIWSLPDRFLMQDIGSKTLRDAFHDDDLEEAWDDFFECVMDMRATDLVSGRVVLPHRFGGWPIPEQGDPRFNAAASSHGVYGFGRTPNEAERLEAEGEIDQWTLLLQVGISDICTSFAEGVVYFVMRETDLKAANFDRVHAIYQQT